MRSVRTHTWPEWMKLDHAARLGGPLEIRAGEDDERGLAPQLENARDQALAAERGDLPSRRHRAREHDSVREIRERGSRRPPPRHDLEDIRGISRLHPEVAQQTRREGA